MWRNSSPHNKWIEDSKGHMLWHSDGANTISTYSGLWVGRKDGKERVIQYWGSDSGMPRYSTFKLTKRGR